MYNIEKTNQGIIQGTTPRQTTTGVSDYLNADSDGDNCSDANEAYNSKSIDGNGNSYYNPTNLPEPLRQVSGAVDNKGKVILASYRSGDNIKVTDRDAASSVCNSNNCSTSSRELDWDGDGIHNNCDLDWDNDGISNELAGTSGKVLFVCA